MSTVTKSAPESTALSSNSRRIEAGRSITSPAAIFLATSVGKSLTGFLEPARDIVFLIDILFFSVIFESIMSRKS